MDVKQTYMEQSINAATPERKLQALLHGAVGFIHQARKALAEGALDTCHNATIKAQNIYLELLIALDPEAGDYVPHLQGIYYLVYDILLDANIRKDDARFEEAQRIAEQVRDLWEEVIGKSRTEPPVLPVADSEPAAAEPRRHINIAG
ncbi:MAG: Flagellar secretion chaperone FliS [bacterium]|nr:Flagellar secretion chaperone FliS [bacterium]